MSPRARGTSIRQAPVDARASARARRRSAAVSGRQVRAPQERAVSASAEAHPGLVEQGTEGDPRILVDDLAEAEDEVPGDAEHGVQGFDLVKDLV